MAGQSLHELVLEVGYKNLPKATKELEKALGGAANLKLNIANLDEIRKHIEKVLGKSLEDVIKNALKGAGKGKFEVALDFAKAGMEKIGGITEAVEGAIQKGFQNLKAGDLFAGLKDLGKGMEKKLDNVAKKLEKGGMGKLGSMLGGLSSSMGMLGSVAGLLSTLVNMFLQIDKEVKDLNKTLLESGSTAQDLGAGFGEVTKEINIARKAARDFRNNLKFGTNAKEQMAILKSFNEAGVLMRNMSEYVGGAANKMEAYQKATSSALTYSKLFGVSATEIATTQAKFMEEQGLDMKAMEQRFSQIYKAADMAGFGTKRFYSMVLNATSGMSMYNVRMEEAASLMLSLSKALDPSKAAAFLQTLAKGYTEDTYQERVKKIMITGSKTTQKIMSANADRVAKDFANKFNSSLGKGGQLTEALSDAGLADIGIDLTTEKGRKETIKKLSQMSEKEIASVTAKLKETDPSGVMTREFGKLYDASKGTTGKMGDMAKAMDDLGPGGTLAMKLAEGNALLGPIHERSLTQLMATESMQGLSGEQLKQMQQVSRDMHGSYKNLQDVAASGEIQKLQGEERTKKQQELLDAYGATVDAQGNIVTSLEDGAKPVEDFTSFIMANSDRFGELTAEKVDENTMLAREIATNTTELAKIMENGVQAVLERLFDIVFPMAQWVLKKLGVDIRDPRETAKAIERMRKDLERGQNSIVEKQTEIKELEKKIQEEGDPGMRAVLEEQLSLAKDQLKGIERAQVRREGTLRRTQEAAVGGGTVDASDDRAKMIYQEFGEQGTQQMERRSEQLRESMVAEMEHIGVNVNKYGTTTDEMIESFERHVQAGLEQGMNLSEAMDAAQQSAVKGIMPVVAQRAKMEKHGWTEEEYEKMKGVGVHQLGERVREKQERKVRIGRGKKAQTLLERSEEVGLEQAKKELTEQVGEDEAEAIIAQLGEGNRVLLEQNDKKFKERSRIEEEQKQKQAEAIAKLNVKEEEKARITRAVQSIYGMGKVPKNIMDKIQSDPTSAIQSLMGTQAYQSKAPTLQRLYPELFGMGAGGPVGPAGDFIYRPGERPMMFNPGDTVIGVKPGGPLAGTPVGGGGKNVTINVNGGDPQQVYKVVKKALMDSGMSP